MGGLLLLQPICFGLEGFPWSSKREHWTLSQLIRCDGPDYYEKAVYTLFGEHLSPCDAVEALSVSARMQLVAYRQFALVTKNRLPHLGMKGSSRSGWVMLISRIAARATTVLLFENSLQLKLQASALAIGKAAGSGIDYLTCMSLVFGLFM